MVQNRENQQDLNIFRKTVLQTCRSVVSRVLLTLGGLFRLILSTSDHFAIASILANFVFFSYLFNLLHFLRFREIRLFCRFSTISSIFLIFPILTIFLNYRLFRQFIRF